MPLHNQSLFLPIHKFLYNAFATAGPTWNLILPATLLFLVALCGVCMNLFVVYVTARSPKIRGSAHYLMAMICLGEVIHQMGHSLFFVVAISGTNFINLFTANLILIVSEKKRKCMDYGPYQKWNEI